MRTVCCILSTMILAISAGAADDTARRLTKATAALAAITISSDRIAGADCIAVMPGFKKGAAGVGVRFGRGFISCRRDGGWSAPAAITLETASLGVQLGGEEIDIVMLSLDKTRRAKLLSERFTVGSDASAAWATGRARMTIPMRRSFFMAAPKAFSPASVWTAPPSSAIRQATKPSRETMGPIPISSTGAPRLP
jgi:lipid-binding SYLF domain-containing protein